MNSVVLTACILTSVLLFAGFNGSPRTATPPTSNLPILVNKEPHLDHALSKLPTVKLWLGAHELEAEIAKTTAEVATGMMFRKKMGENEGMLFIFGGPQSRAFYMKNC